MWNHSKHFVNMLWWNRIAKFLPQLNRRITIRKILADFSLAEFFSVVAVKNTAIGDG